MDTLTLEEKNQILSDIRWTPTTRNTQPFRLQFEPSKILIFCEPGRCLTVSDPHFKDLETDLGSLLEALALSLQALRFSVLGYEKSEFFTTQNLTDCLLVVRFQKSEMQVSDLYPILNDHFCYRGRFQSQNIEEKIRTLSSDHLTFSTHRRFKKAVAALNDRTRLKFLMKPGYAEELYTWMRFSETHPQWNKDGLISTSRLSRFALEPKTLRRLHSLRLAPLFVSESSITQSAPALAMIKAPFRATFLEQGRIFYRMWLKLAKEGLYGAPLSFLANDFEAVQFVKKIFPSPSPYEFVSLLRVGTLPKNYRRLPPARLPASEFLKT